MIRLANEKDIPEIFKLLQEVLLVHHNIRSDLFKEKGSKYTVDEFKEILSNPLFGNDFTPREKDLLLMALLIHDGLKYNYPDKEELFQVGVIGLINAYKNFSI